MDKDIYRKTLILEKKYNEADELALEIVEDMARHILRKHLNMEEFVMGMGTAFFADENGGLLDGEKPYTKRYMKKLFDFIDEWDEFFKLTGTPMRISIDRTLFVRTGEIKFTKTEE
jgi:hypothetical protein